MQRQISISQWTAVAALALLIGINASPAAIASSQRTSTDDPTTPTPSRSHVLPDPNTVVRIPQSTSGSSPTVAPLQTESNQSCSAVNGGVYSESCWETLNVKVYLIDPVVGWNQTVPICGIRGSASDRKETRKCCTSTEPWSTCFLRLATLNPGLDCSSLQSPYCSIMSAEQVAAPIAPHVHYVIKNIVTVNNFFSVYWTALQYAVTQAKIIIPPLVNRLDPFHQTKWSNLNILTLFTFALAFIAAPSIHTWLLQAGQQWHASLPLAAGIFATGIQNSPPTAKMLVPRLESLTSQEFQEDALDEALDNAAVPLRQLMDNALQFLMNDITAFTQFVSGGQFSGAGMISLPQKTAGLDFALKTYMTSVSMSTNGWLVHPDTNGYYDSFLDACDWGEGPGWPYNICSDNNGRAFYWSPDTGRTYSLFKADVREGEHSDTLNMLLDIVNNEWAALNVLFDGSYNCTAEGHDSIESVRFNFDGSLNIACTSQLKHLIGCRDFCPPLENGTCPFRVTDTCNGEEWR